MPVLRKVSKVASSGLIIVVCKIEITKVKIN